MKKALRSVPILLLCGIVALQAFETRQLKEEIRFLLDVLDRHVTRGQPIAEWVKSPAARREPMVPRRPGSKVQ